MKITKQALRLAAREGLRKRGYQTDIVGGPGIVHGARLRATMGSAEHEVAVRTSLDREVGLMRRDDGKWRTIPNVKKVVVAVPSATYLDLIEVFCFNSKTLIARFDAALKGVRKRTLSYRAPVFLALDEIQKKKSGPLAGGLGADAEWREEVALTSTSVRMPDEFIERVKREFAERNGVDVGKVVVEFRIVA